MSRNNISEFPIKWNHADTQRFVKQSQRDGAIWDAVSVSKRTGIPSGPWALSLSRVLSTLATSSGVNTTSSNKDFVCFVVFFSSKLLLPKFRFSNVFFKKPGSLGFCRNRLTLTTLPSEVPSTIPS
jgi:hypothetical protein